MGIVCSQVVGDGIDLAKVWERDSGAGPLIHDMFLIVLDDEFLRKYLKVSLRFHWINFKTFLEQSF